MPRDASTKQVATRVDLDTWEILRIGLLVTGADGMQELLRPVIEKYAKTLEAEPEVQKIATETHAFRSRKSGVTKLPKKSANG